MKLTSVTICNFRCFGPKPQVIPLGSDLVALLGANGSGKSAVLAALARVFGLSSADRSILRSDFHLPPGKTWDDVGPITLSIQLDFELPELKDSAKNAGGVAAVFKHLAVHKAGGSPMCRARLRATWTPSSLAEGDIDAKAEWILISDKDEERCQTISAEDRAAIVVHYIPATRDPIRHLRQSAGSILHNFLRAISWSGPTRKAVENASKTIRTSMSGEAGMKTINTIVESCWRELHKEGTHSTVVIQPVAKRIEDLIAQVETIFQPSPTGTEESVDRLSDGQRSLFYLALVAMSFDVQARLRKDKAHGLETDRLRRPALTILAVEEPENHVSPHFLGRIVTQLNRIADAPDGQVVLTSHSASIMARIDPECVRHLVHDAANKRSTVRRIKLPAKGTDKEKYVREAVQAYPELYFAKLVVFGEGDSEAVVVPRLVRAVMGSGLDTSLISFVPLGGRHVNHFWRLLSDLGIPFVTLLDLDLGREGAGWSRIKYAVEQLLAIGVDEKKLLEDVTREELSKMHTWVSDSIDDTLKVWIKDLENYGVYFSEPLDLDYSMLRAFPSAYRCLEAGERGPNEADEASLLEAILGEKSEAADYYATLGIEHLSWYRYLFLGRGKPATHALALGRLKDAELAKDAPKYLQRLAEHIVKEIDPDYVLL